MNRLFQTNNLTIHKISVNPIKLYSNNNMDSNNYKNNMNRKNGEINKNKKHNNNNC